MARLTRLVDGPWVDGRNEPVAKHRGGTICRDDHGRPVGVVEHWTGSIIGVR